MQCNDAIRQLQLVKISTLSVSLLIILIIGIGDDDDAWYKESSLAGEGEANVIILKSLPIKLQTLITFLSACKLQKSTAFGFSWWSLHQFYRLYRDILIPEEIHNLRLWFLGWEVFCIDLVFLVIIVGCASVNTVNVSVWSLISVLSLPVFWGCQEVSCL